MPVITDHVAEGEIVDPALSRLDDDETTIEFPPGEYKLGSFTSTSDGITLLAPEGDVTLEIIGSGATMLGFSGDGWRVEGFEFDFTDSASSPKQLLATGSGWAIERCVWRGGMRWTSERPDQAIAARIDYRQGDCIIRDCYFPDGSSTTDNKGYGHAIRTLPRSIGHLHIERSWFEGWAESAIATAASPGTVTVAACHLQNTNSALHVNGEASLIRCTLINDDDVPVDAATGRHDMRTYVDGATKMDLGEVYIEDCDFIWTDSTSEGHPIDDHTGADQLTMYKCRIHNTTGDASIAVGGGRADLVDIEVSGSAEPLQQTGGFIGSREIVEVDEQTADPRPWINQPPSPGTTPAGEGGAEPSIGEPGGARGRFYDV